MLPDRMYRRHPRPHRHDRNTRRFHSWTWKQLVPSPQSLVFGTSIAEVVGFNKLSVSGVPIAMAPYQARKSNVQSRPVLPVLPLLHPFPRQLLNRQDISNAK